MAGAFGVDATSFLISPAFLFLIRPPARHTDTRAHPWTQFLEGLRYVRGDPVTVTTVIVASPLFFGYFGATFVGLPVLAKGPFGAGPVVLGRVMAIMLFGIFGLYPVSSGRAGWVSEAIGVRELFVAGGAMIVAAGLLGLASPAMRGVD